MGRMLDILSERESLNRIAARVSSERWFGSKTRQIAEAVIRDSAEVRMDGSNFLLALIDFRFDDCGEELYFVPLLLSEKRDEVKDAWFETDCGAGKLYVGDALQSADFIEYLMEIARSGSRVNFGKGSAHYSLTRYFRECMPPAGSGIRRMEVEQSNSSSVIGGRAIYKTFRRLQAGINPDYEMPLFISQRSASAIVPRPLAYLEYSSGERMALGILSEYVPNDGDCWKYFTSTLLQQTTWGMGSPEEIDDAVADIAGTVAEMHNVLSGGEGVRGFEPERIGEEDVKRWLNGYTALRERTLASLSNREKLPARVKPLADQLLSVQDSAADVRELFGPLLSGSTHKIRTHGDLHLGQILRASGRYIIIDFEGEPMRDIGERRMLHCALRDVAGMLRSLDYAVMYAHRASGSNGEDAAKNFSSRMQRIFLDSYWRNYRPVAAYLPPSFEGMTDSLKFFVREKAMYEIAYELNNRPDWTDIPLRALLSIL